MIYRDHPDYLTPEEIDRERSRLRRIAEAEEILEMQERHDHRVAEEETVHAAGNTAAGGRDAGWRLRLW